jgi:RHS repeat-associated protein
MRNGQHVHSAIVRTVTGTCEYDAAGNLIARISPSQSLVYSFDARYRMESVTRTVDGEAPSTTTYEYDQVGNRTALTTGGVRNEDGYDRRHRLGSLIKRTAAGAMLLAMNYQVDASGLRMGVEESDASGLVRSLAYAYDATGRLIRESIDHRDDAKDRIGEWTYDRVGNRLSQTLTVAGTPSTTAYAYDANDRLLSETGASSTSYSYDAQGNTVGKQDSSGSTSYSYDDANRLIGAITPQAALAYAYTADGLRISQTVTASGSTPITTHYVQDTAYLYAQVIEEYTAEGASPRQLSATFTFADELVSQTRYDQAGTPATAFVQADGFGSTRWLSDATGTLTDAIDFDAFGNEIARNGSTEVEHRYRAERWDENLAAYDLRARLYTPSNGRFLTQDSFAGNGTDPASLHKYLYANSDPVNLMDPSGFMSMASLSAGTSANMALMLSSVRVGAVTFGRVAANDALWATAASGASYARAGLGIITSLVLTADSQRRDRFGLGPVIVFGNEFPEHAQHILDAQTASGTNFVASPFALNRSLPWQRGWLRYTSECDNAARQRAGGSKACDEFPFASARQGGPANYVFGSVSLRLLDLAESNRTRNFIGQFYARAALASDGFSKESRFMAIGIPGSRSFYTDRSGNVHYWNQ